MDVHLQGANLTLHNVGCTFYTNPAYICGCREGHWFNPAVNIKIPRELNNCVGGKNNGEVLPLALLCYTRRCNKTSPPWNACLRETKQNKAYDVCWQLNYHLPGIRIHILPDNSLSRASMWGWFCSSEVQMQRTPARVLSIAPSTWAADRLSCLRHQLMRALANQNAASHLLQSGRLSCRPQANARHIGA